MRKERKRDREREREGGAVVGRKGELTELGCTDIKNKKKRDKESLKI